MNTNTINELIARYCSMGVEYAYIGDILGVNRGKRLTKKDLSDSGQFFVYHGSKDTPLGKYHKFNAKGDTVIVVNTGGIGGVAYCKDAFWCSDGSFYLGHSSRMNNKFVYYYLSQYETYFFNHKRIGGVPTIDRSIVEMVKIPVPSLSVQEEIVKILDTYSELEAELEAKLEAEIDARKKQYEYYKNKLLNSENISGEDIKFLPLSEIAYYPNKRIDARFVNEDNYVSVENLLKDKQGKTKSTSVPTQGSVIEYIENDILIGNIRPYLKKIWLATNTGGTNGDVVLVRIKNEQKQQITPDFLYHILMSEKFFDYDNQYARGAKMPRGNKDMILKYSIPLPPIENQKRIVAILDEFNKLTNEIFDSLQAEIDARKKQYEYYRNKLLTFKEAV